MARTLTPAERRELGEALLVRFEESMRVAYRMFRYHQAMYAKHGGSTYNQLADEYRVSFHRFYKIRQKARSDVEFNTAIPFARPWNEAAKADYAPDATWALGGDNGWTESELRLAAGDR
jgi:histidinol phosphatase-like enzyme